MRRALEVFIALDQGAATTWPTQSVQRPTDTVRSGHLSERATIAPQERGCTVPLIGEMPSVSACC